uniref:Uncharacterized protein n=1 Tax=Anguilla anguilla TaxID=7936 RepID=A0A0E9QGU3_ANGAN
MTFGKHHKGQFRLVSFVILTQQCWSIQCSAQPGAVAHFRNSYTLAPWPTPISPV